MRQLLDHSLLQPNEHVKVYVMDEPDPDAGGACHHYLITGSAPMGTRKKVKVSIEELEEILNADEESPVEVLPSGEMVCRKDLQGADIRFQHGPVKEVGANGLTEVALLSVLLDRYRAFQKSQWSCRENALTITALEEALMWQHKRTLDRMRRKVEGTNAL